MKFILVTLALSALGLAAPLTNGVRDDSGGLGGLLSSVESYLPIVGGNAGPIIPGIAGDKREEKGELENLLTDLKGYLDGTNKLDLGDLLADLEGYLPIVGGNKGPLIPGLAGDKRDEKGELENLVNDLQGYLDGTNKLDLGDLLADLEGYLPIVGGNKGPIIPGLAGDK